MIKENIVPLSDGKAKLLTDDIQKAETFNKHFLYLCLHTKKVIFDLITGIASTWAGRAESHDKRRNELEMCKKIKNKRVFECWVGKL